jgi:hypothetical protein
MVDFVARVTPRSVRSNAPTDLVTPRQTKLAVPWLWWAVQGTFSKTTSQERGWFSCRQLRVLSSVLFCGKGASDGIGQVAR